MKILFASTPVPGHLNPLLAIARLAQERGDTVIVTTGGALKLQVEAAGFRFEPLAAAADFDYRDVDAAFPERASLTPGPAQLRFDLERIFVDTMSPQAETLRRLIGSEAPDLLVVDNLFLGSLPLLLGSAPRPPIVTCCISVLMIERPDGAPMGLGLPPAVSTAERQRYAAMKAEVDEVFSGPVHAHLNHRLAALDVPPLDMPLMQARLVQGEAVLLTTVPAFEYDFGTLPAHVHFVGALPAPPVTERRPPWWDDLDGSRRVVLVTQGTVANVDFDQLIRPTIAALADREDLLVLVTTGGKPVEAIAAPLPPNARVASFLPFDELLPRTDLLVTNGGYGTVQLALRAGVPIVTAGLTEDKAEVGARVEWSGVGVNLNTNCPTREAIQKAVEDVLLRPSYRERAAAFASDFATHDTAREILAIIDDAATRRPHA